MKTGGLAILILVLSLASWYFFYIERMPLTTAETSVVTGFWILVVLSGRWLFTRMRRVLGRKEDEERRKKNRVRSVGRGGRIR